MPFRDCIGHRRLLAVLARAVARGALPQSLMLAGPDGIGKRRVAVAVAQALNCPTPRRPAAGLADPGGRRVTADAAREAARDRARNAAGDSAGDTAWDTAWDIDACGTCPSCLRIERGVHPDVVLLGPGPAGSIKIDQVRDVVDRAAFRPFEGRRRVVIVDEADALVEQAQNALLKTLEEPPPASVFLLVTARPDAMLPTVRSRCPLLRFRPLDVADVATALVRTGLPEAQAHAVAAAADGSIGRALSASAGDLLESRDAAAHVLQLAAASADVRRRLEGAKELVAGGGTGAAERDHVARHLRAMSALLRDVELLANGGEPAALANLDVRADLDRLSAYGGERGVRAFEAVDRALMALEGNASAKTVADWLLLQL